MTLSKIYSYVAACVTLLAGILLLILFILDTRINWMSIFFLVSGFFQIFWVVPIVKIWRNYWYYAGIVGSLISIAFYVEYPIFLLGILTEVFQAIFIVICGIILWKNRSIGDKISEGIQRLPLLLVMPTLKPLVSKILVG